MMARRRLKPITRKWVIRGAIAIGAGMVVGFITGAVAVRITQPAGVVDAEPAAADSGRKARRGPNAAGTGESTAAPEAPRVMGTLVPKLVGLEEGDARNAITRAGFTVGTVLFKSSAAPAGTVLSSFPVPGESVPLPATVNLVLSDGRPRLDSLSGPAVLDSAIHTIHQLP